MLQRALEVAHEAGLKQVLVKRRSCRERCASVIDDMTIQLSSPLLTDQEMIKVKT